MKKPSHVRLSQCMIVKNEEKNIVQALSWGKGLVDEQIVVDTGSTDRTVEIAEEMGASVFHFQWIDDFSAAKNYALEQAAGNWIAFLDADEYFSEESIPALQVTIEKAHAEKGVDAIQTKCIHLDDDGSMMGLSLLCRIFRNDPNLRYRYRIHEALYHRKWNAPRVLDLQDRLAVIHTGYSRHAMNTVEKGLRNAALLQRDLEEYPKDAMRYMYLAEAYSGIEGREEDMLACYRKVLWDSTMERDDDFVMLRSGFALINALLQDPDPDVKDEYFKTVELLREWGGDAHPDLDYYLGGWYLRENNLSAGAASFESAVNKLDGGTYRGHDTIRMTSNLEMVYCTIALVALETDLQKAVTFSVKALQVNKYSGDGIRILLHAFLREWKEGTPADPYWQFLHKLYDMDNLKDVMFIRRFAGETGFYALEKLANEALPPEARV